MFRILSTTIDILFKGFASMILPGFGQLQNGEWRKAVSFLAAFCFSTLCLNSLVSLFAPQIAFKYLFLSALGSFILVWICGIFDAMVYAWKNRNQSTKPWQKFSVYCLFIAMAYLIWFGVIDGLIWQGYVRSHVVDRFRIPSQSMLPTLENRDLIFAKRRSHCNNCTNPINHGDVVLFTNPVKPEMILIKRVIGKPGDTILISGNHVYRNGKNLTQEENLLANGHIQIVEKGTGKNYTTIWKKRSNARKEYLVPNDSFFVMGDNRNRSNDSRVTGSIPVRNVFATPLQIFLSFDRNWQIRWERIGMPII